MTRTDYKRQTKQQHQDEDASPQVRRLGALELLLHCRRPLGRAPRRHEPVRQAAGAHAHAPRHDLGSISASDLGSISARSQRDLGSISAGGERDGANRRVHDRYGRDHCGRASRPSSARDRRSGVWQVDLRASFHDHLHRTGASLRRRRRTVWSCVLVVLLPLYLPYVVRNQQT